MVIGNENAITFVLSDAQPYQTKSVSRGSILCKAPLHNEIPDLMIRVTEKDFHSDDLTAFDSETKGIPYDDSRNPIKKFYVEAYHYPNPTPLFASDLEYSGSAINTGYYWPLTTPEARLTFFGYAKSNENGVLQKYRNASQNLPSFVVGGGSAETGWRTNEGSFWYQLPGPSSDKTDAVKTPDLVFAVAPNQTNNRTPVELNFYHALSAIEFKTGSAVPGDLKIHSVSFQNVYSSGTCEYVSSSNGVSFEWKFENTDVKKTYSQSYDETLKENMFMLIPQTISDDAVLEIAVSFETRNYTIRKKLNQLTSKWVPGKQYTFMITSPDEVQLYLNDDVEGPVKKNLQIKNTGVADVFVRAALIGNWVIPNDTDSYDDDTIVDSWNASDSYGEFVWGTGNESWVLHTDGYYYYKTLLKSGVEADKLFETYTLKSRPLDNAVLDLTVVVQAVLPEDADAALWPDVMTSAITLE